MSNIVKLAAAAIAIALTAAIVGVAAYDLGRADPRERWVRYDLSLSSPVPVVSGSVGSLTLQGQSPRYRLRLAPNTVVDVDPRPSCHYPAWRTISGSDSR
jgi:hypothetical protein